MAGELQLRAKKRRREQARNKALRARAEELKYGKFAGRGKLLGQVVTTDDGANRWYNTLTYYPRKGWDPIRLHRDISAINVFFAARRSIGLGRRVPSSRNTRLLKGRVAPLRIDSYLCEPKEPRDTFLPLMVVR